MKTNYIFLTVENVVELVKMGINSKNLCQEITPVQLAKIAFEVGQEVAQEKLKKQLRDLIGA